MGNVYTRIGNPTNAVLEERMAALDGGVAALAVGSGQAAGRHGDPEHCPCGDNIVSSTDLYGGSWNAFANTFKTMGIEVRFVDPQDPEAFRRAATTGPARSLPRPCPIRNCTCFRSPKSPASAKSWAFP